MLSAIDTDVLAALAGTAVATAATPGPNNLLMLSTSAAYGRLRALPVYLGICLGFPFMVLVVSATVHWFGQQMLAGMEYLRWAGAAFLLFIAWKLFTAEPGGHTERNGGRNRPVSFWQVVALQWLNPKAWGMAAATTAIAGQAWMLPAIVYLVVIFPAVGIWYFSGGLLRRYVLGTPYERHLNRAMALLLAVSVVMILW
jgi:threonine/homoserine/homoserine lactone efflux protein